MPNLVAVLRRRWPVVAICVVLAAVATFAIDLTRTKQYTAQASLLFRDPGFDQKLLGTSFVAPSTDPAREAATNVRLVSLRAVAERTARALGDRIGAAAITESVSASAEGQSDVVAIRATTPDPKLSAQLANTFGQQYIAFRRDADRAKIAEARQLVDQQIGALPRNDQSDRAKTLRAQSETLRIMSYLQTGNAELVQTAEVPGAPSSPRPKRDVALGLFLGLLLGGLLALVIERFDRRMRDAREIEGIYDRPLLAEIPRTRALNHPSRDGFTPISREAEAFGMLRANLRYFNVSQDVRSLIVTSAAPGDGKTTIAVHLAKTAALQGAKVLVIEADLRRPTMSDKLDCEPQQGGLTGVLSGEMTLAEARFAVPAGQETNGSGPRTLDVLLAGAVPPNPVQMLESERMGELIRAAQEEYDLVVIDTPPATVVPDVIPLMNRVDGVLIVALLGKSTREKAQRLRQQLENLEAPVLGVVVNAAGEEGEYYGYAPTAANQR